jgi:putative sigma-54 modulation protein
MQFEIRGRDIDISEVLRDHIGRRLGFALDRFAGRIRHVHVTLGDLNGLRGGIDKCCKLAISVDCSSPIVVESHASNVYAAIDCVADKAATCISRRLKRPHGRNRSRRISELLSHELTIVVVRANLQTGGAT